MRRTFTCYLALSVLLMPAVCFAGPAWVKLRYLGGTVQARVNPFDWNTSMDVSSDWIVISFGPGKALRIKPAQVLSVSADDEARRRVAEIVTGGITPAPPGLFGLLKPGKDHMIGIVYQTDDGRKGAVLLQVQRLSFWPLLSSLRLVIEKPVDFRPHPQC